MPLDCCLDRENQNKISLRFLFKNKIDILIICIQTFKMDLIEAVVNNDIEEVKLLLEQGADPNVTLDEAELTPLHFAAQNNAVEIAELLFTAGADLDSETDEGQTPLDVAREFRHEEMIKLLVRLKHKGGDTGASDNGLC